MKFTKFVLAAAMMTGLGAGGASAQGFLISANGLVAIGVNAEGHLDTNAGGLGGPVTANAGPLGIAYNFSGQGSRSGWQDALSPGCLCERWGVAGNGQQNSIGVAGGNNGITAVSNTFVPGTSFTSVATGSLSGLTVTQVVTRGVETATGALFKAEVTIANTTGATITDVQYARAMDWDVPPTEFNEYVTHAGVSIGGTSLLLRATDDGFAGANPLSDIINPGIAGVVNSNGDQGGISDHGSLFIFGFGDLLAGDSKSFTIFYGAGANLADANALIGLSGAELSSFGQSSGCTASSFGTRCDNLPTFIFAFDNVGLPPIGVPGPAALGLFGLALLGLGAVARRRA